jgi:hypothetical protein
VGPLAIEGQVGMAVPLAQGTFQFHDPDRTGYQVPAVMAEGQLGLGVHFP